VTSLTNFFLGFVFTFLGFFVGGAKFAVLYALGTICAIGGSFFLWGPMSQLKKSFDPDRRVSSIILIFCIICVIVFAFIQFVVCIIFVILQYVAYIYYTICMLPYGRKIFCACIKRGGGGE
jgi:hypothetical protein